MRKIEVEGGGYWIRFQYFIVVSILLITLQQYLTCVLLLATTNLFSVFLSCLYPRKIRLGLGV